MKKIIVGILSAVFLFTGVQSAFASGPFNGQSGDCPNIAIGNYTTGVGIGDGQWNCWTRGSVTASAGDTINVALFYHNNTSSTLTNVAATLSQSSSGPTTSYSFSGQMYSDQGNTSLGTVSLNLNSSQTLIYSSAHWMKDKNAINSDTDSTMLYGQTGSVMKDGGQLKIGSVPPGWNDYGYIIVVFKVGNTVNPQICTDVNALNYGSTGNCIYPQKCLDTSALNYGSVGNCIYPQKCLDTSATNYGSYGSCVYPQKCTDRNANNYGSYGSCTYDRVRCLDSNASNYLNYENCIYPQKCLDTSATNYGSYGSCIYNRVRCLDTSASNYLNYENCIYNRVRCLDTSASNYLDYSSCVYNRVRCLDTNANNYLSYSSCTYNRQTCTDRSATNYGSYGSCTYNQTRCTDASASNYLAYEYCRYNNQVRCLDQSATNYLAYNTCTYNVVLNKNVVTTVATNITTNSAQINGYITNSTFYNSNVYFNYGTDVTLGSKTSPATISGNNSFNSFLTGLTPNTIYYFQAVGENGSGVSKGNIEVFKTLGNNNGGTVTKVIVQGTTVTGSSSPVELKISNKYELIGEGDLIDYVVTYKNIGKTKLSKPMVQVVLPSNITLVNASRGTYSVDTHTLSALVEDLDKGEEGVIYLQAKVDSIPANNAQIVTTAILVYTNTSGAQENAMAYALNTPKLMAGVVTNDNNLGASAFFAGLVSIGLIGWLIIILIILLLILIVHSIYSKPANNPNIHTGTH